MAEDEGTKLRTEAILQRAEEPARGVDDVRLIGRNRAGPGSGPSGSGGPSPGNAKMQSAILPWRRGSAGRIELLLITSRGGNRWIIPKGWPMPGMTLQQSASQEAFEEAGVRGDTDARPVGRFITEKTDWLGRTQELDVVVYAMKVREELADWPEKHERMRCWCCKAEAVKVVESLSLKALIESASKSLEESA